MREFDIEERITLNGIEREDGVIFSKDSFQIMEDEIIPIVYDNDITTPGCVMGYARLVNRDDGVYAQCKFNDSVGGRNAQFLLSKPDEFLLSFSATKILRSNKDVIRGHINCLHITPKFRVHFYYGERMYPRKDQKDG